MGWSSCSELLLVDLSLLGIMSKVALVVLLAFIGAPVIAGVGCSATDQAYIHAHKGSDASSIGQSASDCGHAAYSIWHGFSKQKFDTCLKGKTQVSDTCTDCYAGAGQYGVDNCKLACFSSWCSSSCLSCTAKYLGDLKQCTGFEGDAVSPCSGGLSMSLNMTVVV